MMKFIVHSARTGVDFELPWFTLSSLPWSDVGWVAAVVAPVCEVATDGAEGLGRMVGGEGLGRIVGGEGLGRMLGGAGMVGGPI